MYVAQLVVVVALQPVQPRQSFCDAKTMTAAIVG